MVDRENYVIYLCGYTKFGHTNWYPWKKFYDMKSIGHQKKTLKNTETRKEFLSHGAILILLNF